MLRLISDEVRRAGHHFQTRDRGWYVVHIISVFVLSLVIGGGMFWSQFHNAQASILSPLNNYRPKDFAIVEKNGLWHVFAIYVCINQSPPCDTTPRGLMHLTSKNLSDWTEEGYVIPPGTPGSWDATDVWAPSIVEQSGTYYMFYTGVKQNGLNVQEQKIGLATSTDLYSWTKSPSNPIVDCTNLAWAYWDANDNTGDGAACRDPNVIWNPDQSEWVMAISGRSLADSSPVNHPATVGLATSNNLLDWTAAGYISSANGYVTESPHLVKHASTWHAFWTDNCTGGRCIKYATSSSTKTGYGVKSNLVPAEANAYASEYYQQGATEYFASVGNSNITLSFQKIVWSGTPFTLQEIPFGSISGTTWTDTDGDGTIDANEEGIDGVTVSLYKDTGDDSFSSTSDFLYDTVTTGDDSNTVGTQHGFFTYGTLIPGTYWRSVQPTNYASGNMLDDLVPTTGSSVEKIIVADNQVVTDGDLGETTKRTVWDPNDSNIFSTSTVTLLGGRAFITSGTGYIELASSQAIPFSRVQQFSVDMVEQGGAIRFILSNDQGASWMYWNGSAWVTSNGTIAQGTTLANLQSHIESFPEGEGMFQWRALMQGSGTTTSYIFRVGATTNHAPSTPAMVSPADGQAVTSQPQLRFSSTDVEHDGIEFSVDVDTTTSFNSANVLHYTHLSSQFGWSGQDTRNRTQYSDGTVATVQMSSPLLPGTWYWRVTAQDSLGADRPSPDSSIRSFVVTTPITLNAISIVPSSTSMVVRWTTPSSVTSWVQYGTSVSYGATSSTSIGTEHVVTLSGLSAAIKYHLRIVADIGSSRVVRSSDRIVQTSGTTISGMTIETKKDSAIVRWMTSEAATTKVVYGASGGALSKTVTGAGLRRSHVVTISGLRRSSRYQLRVLSIGTTTAQSTIQSFTTKAK